MSSGATGTWYGCYHLILPGCSVSRELTQLKANIIGLIN